MTRPFALSSLLLAAACASPPAASPPPAAATPASFTGTRWVGAGADPGNRNAPALEFVTEGRLAGYTGCNLMSGAWRIEAGELRIGRLVTTKRMCVGPESEVEQRVLAVLVESARFTREGDRLVATTPQGARYEFLRAR
ncbi:MAG TPA: META domain-containing protein [Usitatibacter sp.]|nr:META domain-containing protein [Usitatibacter sp.]